MKIKPLKAFRMMERRRRGRRREPSHTEGGAAQPAYIGYVPPLNEALQHRDAVTSCTSRKHCRIAP